MKIIVYYVVELKAIYFINNIFWQLQNSIWNHLTDFDFFLKYNVTQSWARRHEQCYMLQYRSYIDSWKPSLHFCKPIHA